MSYLSDTKRCPYCRGDMLVTTHMASGWKIMECAACGTQESIDWNEKGNLVHKRVTPTAFVAVMYSDGIQEFPYFGKHPYKWVKEWKHSLFQNAAKYEPDIIARESFGVVYNKKHNKLVVMFGKPPIYPDEYYEDDECIY